MSAPIDMTRFIEAKSDQLNADDLIGGPRTITITRVSANDGDQPVNVYFDGDNGKPFRPCKTIRRVMVAMWGTDASQYVGRSMTIYRDPSVQFGGMQVGGIRISHMSHIDNEKTVVVMKSKGKKAGMAIKPLVTRPAFPTRSPESPVPPAATSEQPQDAGSGAASNGDDERAAKWVGTMMRKIAACDSIAELAELQRDKAEAIADLAAYPKQHGDLVQAFLDRRAVIEGEGE